MDHVDPSSIGCEAPMRPYCLRYRSRGPTWSLDVLDVLVEGDDVLCLTLFSTVHFLHEASFLASMVEIPWLEICCLLFLIPDLAIY